MNTHEEEERRVLVATGARKQLEEGTWPKVMAVFTYINSKAPRTTNEEFIRLRGCYEQAACPNIAQFVELLRFMEMEKGVAMSFNLSLCRRTAPGNAPELTLENLTLLSSCKDRLIGTRFGVEGAAVWLGNFLKAIPILVPETVQVMDRVFGESLSFLMVPSRKTTIDGLFRSAVLDEGDALSPAEAPIIH